MSDVFECPYCQLIVPVYVEEPMEFHCPRCNTVYILNVNKDNHEMEVAV